MDISLKNNKSEQKLKLQVPCKFDRLQGKKYATNVSHNPSGRSQVLVNISVFM